MVDLYTPNKRSQIMAQIRSTGTRPELLLWRIVTGIFLDYEVVTNATDVVGTPDIFIPKARIAFFLDGCFFHGCAEHGHIPKTNISYWRQKIERNICRDRRLRRRLRESGVSVWRFWEHDVKTKVMIEATKKRVQLAYKRIV